MPPLFVIDKKALWDASQRAGLDPVTLNGIARHLDCAPSTLSRVLNGKTHAGHELLARIRATYGPEEYARIVTLDGHRDHRG